MKKGSFQHKGHELGSKDPVEVAMGLRNDVLIPDQVSRGAGSYYRGKYRHFLIFGEMIPAKSPFGNGQDEELDDYYLERWP